ncbi:MAG TPA: hypothetical protein VNF73_15765, partial [Candidatus Saccharimonadales bacterium]|nr:hypothetical protein [Candidatus Saccharimonadales bacterium]
MTRRSIQSLVAGVAVTLVVGACSSSAATLTPIPAASQSAAPSAAPASAEPSAAITTFAIPSFAFPSGGSFTIPSFALPSGDKALEARLPDSINGVTLRKFSIAGADFLTNPSSAGASDLNGALAALGKTPADVSVAVATDPSGELGLTLGAFRIAGTDSGALLNAFVSATQKEAPGATVAQTSIGGKNVTQITNPEQSDQ